MESTQECGWNKQKVAYYNYATEKEEDEEYSNHYDDTNHPILQQKFFNLVLWLSYYDGLSC